MDLYPPTPPPDERLCGQCGRLCTNLNDAMLFRFDPSTQPILTGVTAGAFTRWLYTCRWCRGANRTSEPVPPMDEELWAFIGTMQDDVVPPYVKSCVPKGKRSMSLARQLVSRGLAFWVSQWPLEDQALYLTLKGYERMGWDARFVVEE